jgi:FkbM family methyltransferase
METKENIINFLERISKGVNFNKIWLKNSFLKTRAISILGFLEKEFNFEEFLKLFIFGNINGSLIKFRFYRERKVLELLKKEKLILGKNKIILFNQDFYFINPFEMISQIYSSIINDQYHLKDFLREDSVFMDVGANIGVVSVFASQIIKKGKIFSFEPSGSTFEILKKNLEPYKKICEILNFALGDKSGKVKFIEFYRGFGGNMVYNSEERSIFEKKFQNNQTLIEEVEMITIDEFISLKGINKVDLIKMDVEGYEINVVEGAKETIFNFSPVIVIGDIDFQKMAEIKNTIKKINPKYEFKQENKIDNILICYS